MFGIAANAHLTQWDERVQHVALQALPGAELVLRRTGRGSGACLVLGFWNLFYESRTAQRPLSVMRCASWSERRWAVCQRIDDYRHGRHAAVSELWSWTDAQRVHGRV